MNSKWGMESRKAASGGYGDARRAIEGAILPVSVLLLNSDIGR
jgi:hypothetical protein